MKKSKNDNQQINSLELKWFYLGRQGFYRSRRTKRDERPHSSHGKFYTECGMNSMGSLQIRPLALVVLPLLSPAG